MILYNLKNKQKEFFSFPADIIELPIVQTMKIKKLTDRYFVLSYNTENGEKTKMYSR